jgi:hypothetical protein
VIKNGGDHGDGYHRVIICNRMPHPLRTIVTAMRVIDAVNGPRISHFKSPL